MHVGSDRADVFERDILRMRTFIDFDKDNNYYFCALELLSRWRSHLQVRGFTLTMKMRKSYIVYTINSAQFKVQKLLLCVRIVRAHMGLI